jgi:hypothetical protein
LTFPGSPPARGSGASARPWLVPCSASSAGDVASPMPVPARTGSKRLFGW